MNITIGSGTSEVVELNAKPWHTGIQVSSPGGSLQIDTQEAGSEEWVTQATITDESIIIDLERIASVKLTASDDDIEATLNLRQRYVSTPGGNWNNPVQ